MEVMQAISFAWFIVAYATMCFMIMDRVLAWTYIPKIDTRIYELWDGPVFAAEIQVATPFVTKRNNTMYGFTRKNNSLVINNIVAAVSNAFDKAVDMSRTPKSYGFGENRRIQDPTRQQMLLFHSEKQRKQAAKVLLNARRIMARIRFSQEDYDTIDLLGAAC